MSYKLSVDVGGTFTDIVVFDDKAKKTYVTKVSSTPQDYSIGIEEGIQKISAAYQIPVAEINYFIHGTTVATNALLERKGAKTALITTKGFRDVLEIGRQKRPDLYNFWVKRPEPPIPRYLVFEIDERTLADGSIIRKVEEDNAREVIRQMKKYDVEYPEQNIPVFLDYFNMTKEEFDAVLDKHVNRELFEKKSGIWQPVFCIK